MPESVRIDLPSASLALSLLERLEDFRAEVVPLRGELYQVVVDLDGGPGVDRGQESLARIRSWLESAELDPPEIRLDDRSGRHASAEAPPTRARKTPESIGLVCRVKTIAAGTGVQVVSAEGELDFYTAPRLDALLQSTESEQVILDLTEARFIDSTTLAVVVGAAKRLRKEGRRFSIVSGNTTVARLLQLTGLDRAFEVHPTLVEGVEIALARAVEVEAHRQDESAR